MIRLAEPSDVPALVAMGRAQMGELYPSMADDPAQITAFFGWLLGNPNGVVAVEDGPPLLGMIGVLQFAHPMTGEPTATEMFWFMDKAHRGSAGVRLLKWAERWAEARGVRRFLMSTPPGRVESLYLALGYHVLELTYEKTLCAQ
jgi:GNAT superfamily N-acetyltransferase